MRILKELGKSPKGAREGRGKGVQRGWRLIFTGNDITKITHMSRLYVITFERIVEKRGKEAGGGFRLNFLLLCHDSENSNGRGRLRSSLESLACACYFCS